MRSSSHSLGPVQSHGRCYITLRYVLDSGAAVVTERGPVVVDGLDLDVLRVRIGVEIEAESIASAVRLSEREAARGKVDVVLDDAIKAGALTEDDLRLAGHQPVRAR